MRNDIRRGYLLLSFAAVAAATLTASAYWPGLMTWDPVRQYGEALSGDIDDWHPPAMQWVWRQLISIQSGPPSMLLMQLALYWGGLLLLASTAWQRRRSALAWALLACGLWPLGLALTGMILKDSLMTGTLLVASGLLACGGGVPSRVLAGAMLIVAATLRFNAFTACLPLSIALLPRWWWSSWPRLLGTSLIATAALLAAMPVANRLIGAKPSGVELSLIIFDLGGITEHAGVSVFPEDLDVATPVRVNHRCYQPNKWDSYSDWVDPECPLGFTAWNDSVDPLQVRPYPFWARAVLAHPVAYAEHRLHHFAINTRLLPLPDEIERPVPNQAAPNPWGFHVTPNPSMHALDALAMATAHTPLGWPIVFMGLALGVYIASWGLPNARLISPIALSSLFYGGGYLVFSVAAELRYHLWTELAALIATALLLDDVKGISRSRLLCAFVPAGFLAMAGVITRALA
ncbi:hypothetical protein [Sphingomonas sp.]|uniref:hypothetical protein n=1 Tax=Sphingomonas sp. TaxID=28214 RepID=UPI0025EC7372|nr:hypothetical protein [Sphingomonas sp.]